MFSRELVTKTFHSSGILYSANDLTTAFVRLLKSEYAKALRSRADWLINSFGEMDNAQLSTFMTANVGRWGAEFERLAAIKDLEL
jgi:hypothetical protein